MRLTVLLNIFISTLLCQVHLDILIQEVLSGSKDSAAIYLPMIETQYPNNPNMLFLKGLMETNGEEAMQIFVKLYNNHPTSEYGDDAVMKISEYYYASGLYVQSAGWLKKMPLYYSRSEHIERALKLFLNSLIVSGYRDTAIFYSKVFKKQFPSLDVDGKINDLLNDYENSKQSSINTIQSSLGKNQKVFNSSTMQKEVDKSSKKYSLQSGAFRNQKNAEKEKISIMSAGFNARIVELYKPNKKILYAVRLGYYNTKNDANEARDKLHFITIVVENK